VKAVGLASVLIAVFASSSLTYSTTLTELGGFRAPSAGNTGIDTNATFAIGMTTDNGLSWRSNALPTESLRIVGLVRPEAAQIGQQADIYLVVKIGAVFMMRNDDGTFVQWSGSLAELVPYRKQTTLAADTEVDLYTGKLGIGGEFQLFLGYRGGNGLLRYSPRGFVLSSSANPTNQAPWFYNGTDWKSSGSPSACASPLLQTPLDLSKVTSILYPGQIRGGDYKSHGSFRLDGAGQTNQVNVVSAITGPVVRGERDNANGVVQYAFEIISPCGVMTRLGHLLQLSPKNVFMDFGVYDLRSRNPATFGMSGELRPYGICWLDALPAADSARVLSLPATNGASGTVSDYCR